MRIKSNGLSSKSTVTLCTQTIELTSLIKRYPSIAYFVYKIPPKHHVQRLFPICFFDCDVVRKLWTEVGDWLNSLGAIFPITKTNILFGIHNQTHLSVSNCVILYTKYYIWVTKHKNFLLTLVALKIYLHSKLTNLKNMYLYQDKIAKFDPRIPLFSNLENDREAN